MGPLDAYVRSTLECVWLDRFQPVIWSLYIGAVRHLPPSSRASPATPRRCAE